MHVQRLQFPGVVAAILAVAAVLAPARAGDGRVITGFNQNWSMLPALSTPGLVDNIKALGPRMLRYPGGTVTHNWNWRTGAITTRKPLALHPISDVAALAKATGTQTVVVLDVVNGTVDDQIEMMRALQRAGVKITHIELGNEVYARDKGYEVKFPTGAEYGALAASWTPKLKAAFPGAKVAAVLLGRAVGERNERGRTWNAGVVAGAKAAVDAFIYHLYIPERATAAETIESFKRVAAAAGTGTKELWITEYGTHHATGSPESVADLRQLADFFEAMPNVTIALNHQIIGGDMAKLTPDGAALNAEGQMFAARAKARR